MMFRFSEMATALAAGLLAVSVSVAPTSVGAQSRLNTGDEGPVGRKTPEMTLKRMDANGDGRVSRDEWRKPKTVFDRIDADGDGVLTYQELQAHFTGGGMRGRTPARARDRAAASTQTPGRSAIEWIDVHVHPSPGRRPTPDAKGTLDAALAAMDPNQIARMVLMPQPMVAETWRGEVLPPAPVERWIHEARKYPDRFVVMGGGGSLNAMIHDESRDGHPSDELKRRFAARAEAILDMGAAGFGELAVTHLSMVPGQPYMSVPGDHPLLLMLADIAARRGVVIDVHFDPVLKDIPRPGYLTDPNPAVLKRNLDGFERFLMHNREAKISWAHAGSDRLSFWTAGFTREMLAKHPNLFMSLRMNWTPSGVNHPLAANDDGITADWMKTFEQFPDRFFIGGDQFFLPPALRSNNGPGARFARQGQNMRDRINLFLGYLPPEIARKFAFENAMRIYKITDAGTLAHQR